MKLNVFKKEKPLLIMATADNTQFGLVFTRRRNVIPGLTRNLSLFLKTD
jgi:hypothetical protein